MLAICDGECDGDNLPYYPYYPDYMRDGFLQMAMHSIFKVDLYQGHASKCFAHGLWVTVNNVNETDERALRVRLGWGK